MASALAPVGPTSGRDELDRMLDYNTAVQEFLRDVPIGSGTNDNKNADAPRESRNEDQEVQVRRKRNPIPKLDEERLLSTAGVPQLRRIAKSRLRFRGKGHEFSDISRLLNTYQLWLDDLYPRAKFRDGLTIIEKVGHSKRLQTMRRAWLDETRPSQSDASKGRLTGEPRRNAAGDDEILFHEMVGEDREKQPGGDESTHRASRNELDQLLAQSADTSAKKNTHVKRIEPFEDEDDEDEENAESAEVEHDQPPDDELDALLAEQSVSALAPPSVRLKQIAPLSTAHGGIFQDEHDAYAAEEEAMADIPDLW